MATFLWIIASEIRVLTNWEIHTWADSEADGSTGKGWRGVWVEGFSTERRIQCQKQSKRRVLITKASTEQFCLVQLVWFHRPHLLSGFPQNSSQKWRPSKSDKMWLSSGTLYASTPQFQRFFDALHNSRGSAPIRPTENTKCASAHSAKLHQTCQGKGSNPFISLPPPDMKLQRKLLGAFCCLAAEMCNFWKCSSRVKRLELTTPDQIQSQFDSPWLSKSWKFQVQIKSKGLAQKCDCPPLFSISNRGWKEGSQERK